MATESGNHGEFHFNEVDTINTAPVPLAMSIPNDPDDTPTQIDLTTLDAGGQDFFIISDGGLFSASTEEDGTRSFSVQTTDADGHNWGIEWHLGEAPLLERDGAPVDFTVSDWLL